MASAAALAFDRSKRTVTDLKKFWDKDPLTAAKWVQNVGKAAANEVGIIEKVAAILEGRGTDAAKEKRLAEFAKKTPNLFKVVSEFGEAQAARAVTIGWSAQAAGTGWREPPAFTGTLALRDGHIALETTRGTFDVQLLATSWRDEIETAFLNQTVTLKGYPSTDGKSIAMEQFGPGSSPDFVSGRIRIEGDKVFVAPNNAANQQAEITNPTFKRLLLGDTGQNLVNYNPAGVILPGKVEVKNGRAVYAENPKEGFYLLGRVMAGAVRELPGNKEQHLFETGYFKMSDAISPRGLPIPAETQVDAQVGPAGDTTIGSTKAGEGRRTFFWVNILDPKKQVEGATLTNPRRFEVTWVGHAGDQGTHTAAVVAENLARNLKEIAKSLPAGGDDAPFAPEERLKFSKAK